jgi:hypothetical protein
MWVFAWTALSHIVAEELAIVLGVEDIVTLCSPIYNAQCRETSIEAPPHRSVAWEMSLRDSA